MKKKTKYLRGNLKLEQEKKHEFQESLEKVDDNLSLKEELSMERKIKSKFPCELCGKGFDINNDLQIHFELNHRKQLVLKRLNENFVSLEEKSITAEICSNVKSFQSARKRLEEKTCLPVCWCL